MPDDVAPAPGALTPDTLDAMQSYTARAAAEHGYTRHRYSLADFGLSAGDVEDALAPHRLEPATLAA